VFRKALYGLWLFVLPIYLSGQQVNYSSPVNIRTPGQFRIIGKSGDMYWIEKETLRRIYNRHESSLAPVNRQFAVFNNRLNEIREMPARVLPGTIKEYLVSGKSFFDQLVLVSSPGKTSIIINRYRAEENSQVQSRLVDSFPFAAAGSRFLLLRSEDLSKILLIGFEPGVGESLRVHTILFDEGWSIRHHSIAEHPYFNQPCIQDDPVAVPVESFDNLPVKLANDGEWLMASTSVTNRNYLLFDFDKHGKHFYFREIPVSPYYGVEDIALSIDEGKHELAIGLLSRYRNTSLKNVLVSHYSLTENRFDFDSSYQFNSLAGRFRNQNLSNESFVAIPGAGFMLFKEYGRSGDGGGISPEIDPWDPVYLLAGFSDMDSRESGIHKDGYSVKPGLQGIGSVFDRGNLTMFYFPMSRGDSTWSGIINTAQTTELNAPFLSYLIFPVGSRVYILYNRQDRTTGRETNDPVIFWKMDGLLDYQKARRISLSEVAVPYRDSQRPGFAVIRL
jgi:hypothetical protein